MHKHLAVPFVFYFHFFLNKSFLKQHLLSSRPICDLKYALQINITSNIEREAGNKAELL